MLVLMTNFQLSSSLKTSLLALVSVLIFSTGNASPQLDSLVLSSVGNDGAPKGLRFLIGEDGLYRITADQLTSAGIELPLDSKELRLLSPEGEIAIWLNDSDDGSLDAETNDHLIFYGTYPRGELTTRKILNDRRPYWLIFSQEDAEFLADRLDLEELGSAPLRTEYVLAEEAKERFSNPQHQIRHFRRARYEQDYGHSRWSGGSDKETDFYYYQVLDTAANAVVEFNKIFLGSPLPPKEDDPTSMSMVPTFRTVLHGVSRVKHDLGDHVADIFFNDHKLERLSWDGVKTLDWSTTFSTELLPEDKRVFLRYESPDEKADSVDQIYIDWFEIGYPKYPYKGINDTSYRFSFEGITDPENRGLQIPSIVWNTSGTLAFDPQLNRVYEPIVTEPYKDIEGQWACRFNVELPPAADGDIDPYHQSPIVYFFQQEAINDVTLDLSNHWNPIPFSEWFKVIETTKPRNIILTGPELLPAGERLAEYRTKQEVPTVLINISDVLDYYSSGYWDAVAVTKMIDDFLKNPRGTQLKYLTLLGDSTYDYKGMNERNHPDRNVSSKNVIPLYYYDSRHWNRPVYPADHLFVADPKDENIPRLAVGRIPAASLAEANDYIDKVITYEEVASDSSTPEWSRRALLVSSWERSFSNLLTKAKHAMPPLDSDFLIAEIDEYEASVGKMENTLNEGCGVLYYVGHGGSFVWRVGPVDFQQQKDLFTTNNINQLTNKGRYPIIFVSSCYTTSFDHQRSIGEEFILTPNRGAIAVIGSPWKTSVSPNHRFNIMTMEYLYDPSTHHKYGGERTGDDPIRIGDGFFAAKKYGKMRGDAQIGFTLLGDPALIVNVPEKRESPQPTDAEPEATAEEASI
jgi:hypothetical protein